MRRLKTYTAVRPDSSLALRWRGLAEHANARSVVDASYELVLKGGPTGITGSFPDLWVLCYPDDAQIKQHVEEELARMCQVALDSPPR